MRSSGNRSQIILLVLSGWIFYGLFFACQSYFSNTYFGRRVSFRQILFSWLACSLVWIFLTPLVYKLASSFPLEKGKLGRNISVHLISALLISVCVIGAYTLIWRQTNDGPYTATWRLYQNLVVAEFHFNIFLYFILLGLYYVYNYYRRFRENEQLAARLELEAAQLETRLSKAQLHALKMQIHPHFLFNTLNSISVLMRDDSDAANQMLVRLSELLRVTLNSEATQEVPLRQELEFLRDYLEIEQTRFQDRLTVSYEIDDEILEVPVPNLILQPLAENAIRHGISPQAVGGLLKIRARRDDGYIELSVTDNGDGLKGTSKLSNGIGLRNTQERLEKLYGDDQTFEILSPEHGGLQVKLRIPVNENEQHDSSFDR